ncbi:MAG: T9SS type A sorting domain-containing protein [Bacteroidales bacterium]|nr:T9SS type A sorting domain-containing protein [Bacteroidales bacterium]
MKKQLIILSIIILSFETAISQSTFLRIYNSPEYNTMYSVAETSAQEFILCGYKDIFQGSNFPNAQLLKIDAQGNIIDERVLASDQNQSLFSTLRKSISNDNIFYLTGKMDSVSGNSLNHLLKLWKLDDNLNFVYDYSLNFGDSLNNIPQSFVNVNDSIVYFLSALFRPPLTTVDFSLIKFNLLTYAVKSYFPSWHTLRNPGNIIYDSLNHQLKVLIAGASVKERGFVQLFSFDMDLNYLSGFEPDYYFTSITCRTTNYNSDSYVVSGNISTTTDDRGLYNLFYTNDNELIDSVLIYSNADTITYAGFGNSMLVADTTMWSVGVYNHDPSTFWQPTPNWIQLSRINSDFELTDQFYYGGDGVYWPYDIISTSDGGIMVVGSYFEPKAVPLVLQRDPFVLKVNSEGLIVNVNNPEKPIAQEAIVFPNPGKEFLQVKLAVQHKSAQFQLFDNGGRLVLETDLSGDMQRVETGQLVSGAYIYRITASNRVVGSGMWVKE